MEFDLPGEHQPLAYKLLASLVTPRPIALVTTMDPAGNRNAAPFSFFNVFGSKPPILGICPGDREPGVPKDTALNIRRTGEFVVNLVTEEIAEGMNKCAAELPPGESEMDYAGFTESPSLKVKPPRIAEALVNLECTQHSTIEIGGNRLIIGLIQHLHVKDGVLDPETLRLNPDAYHTVGRMYGADGYCRTRDFFTLKRPD